MLHYDISNDCIVRYHCFMQDKTPIPYNPVSFPPYYLERSTVDNLSSYLVQDIFCISCWNLVELYLSFLAFPKYIVHIISGPSYAANMAGQTHYQYSDTGARGDRWPYENLFYAKYIALKKYDVDVPGMRPQRNEDD